MTFRQFATDWRVLTSLVLGLAAWRLAPGETNTEIRHELLGVSLSLFFWAVPHRRDGTAP